MTSIVRLHPLDSVATLLADYRAGEEAMLSGSGGSVTTLSDIPSGHKVALTGHDAGAPVIKYGAPIGVATRAIAAGEHVHSHNLATLLDSGGDGAQHRRAVPVTPRANDAAAVWQGYDRGPRGAGTRNDIWILPTVGCVGKLAERVAAAASLRHAGRVDGIHAFAHPHGCSQLGDDLDGTRAILAALAGNANAGGVLILALGCESNQADALIAALPRDHAPVRLLRAQMAGDEFADAMALVDALVDEAVAERTALPLSRLRVALKCGGSDGLSGITANPLLGRFTDRLVAAGGSAILSEVPELFGAEHVLFARCTDPATADAGHALVARFKQWFRDHGEPVSENPSPGNIAGGITTLEEKSLGAIQKAGTAPVAEILSYGEVARASGGVSVVEAPGNDAVSSTAMTAAGATLLLFTTGRGTPLGAPVPTMKIASNSALAARKPGWIDFDAGAALDTPVDVVDDRFFAAVMACASGQPCAAERMGQREIAVWKRGVTL